MHTYMHAYRLAHTGTHMHTYTHARAALEGRQQALPGVGVISIASVSPERPPQHEAPPAAGPRGGGTGPSSSDRRGAGRSPSVRFLRALGQEATWPGGFCAGRLALRRSEQPRSTGTPSALCPDSPPPATSRDGSARPAAPVPSGTACCSRLPTHRGRDQGMSTPDTGTDTGPSTPPVPPARLPASRPRPLSC